MAVQLWRRRRGSAARTAPRRRDERAARRAAPGRVRRWQRHDGLSALVWLLAWVSTLVLLFGIALTWSAADRHNDVVHTVLRVGAWLATPFNGIFTDSDPHVRLTENWAFAAGVYLIVGRILAWLLRW